MNKKLILSLFAIGVMFGLTGKAKAGGYITTQSTGLFVWSSTEMTRTGITVERVIVSSGDTYALLVDSIPLVHRGIGGNVDNAALGLTAYPVSQWMTPQIELVKSSQPAAGSVTIIPSVGYKSVEVGYSPNKGLVIYQSAVGGTVTVVFGYKSSQRERAEANDEFDHLLEAGVFDTFDGKPVQVSKNMPGWLKEAGYREK